MKVVDPSGQTWRVSRRWVPWRRRLDAKMPELPSFAQQLGDDPISAIVGVVLLILLLPVLVLAVLVGLELLLLLLVLPFALLGRILFGRHWTIEVRRGWTPFYEERSGDWQASGLLIHRFADQLRRGEAPPQTIG